MDSTSTQQGPTPAYVIARNGSIYSPDEDGNYRNGNGDQLDEHVQQMILAGNAHPDYEARADDGSLCTMSTWIF